MSCEKHLTYFAADCPQCAAHRAVEEAAFRAGDPRKIIFTLQGGPRHGQEHQITHGDEVEFHEPDGSTSVYRRVGDVFMNGNVCPHCQQVYEAGTDCACRSRTAPPPMHQRLRGVLSALGFRREAGTLGTDPAVWSHPHCVPLEEEFLGTSLIPDEAGLVKWIFEQGEHRGRAEVRGGIIAALGITYRLQGGAA